SAPVLRPGPYPQCTPGLHDDLPGQESCTRPGKRLKCRVGSAAVTAAAPSALPGCCSRSSSSPPSASARGRLRGSSERGRALGEQRAEPLRLEQVASRGGPVGEAELREHGGRVL